MAGDNKKFNTTASRFENYYYKKKTQTVNSVGPGSYVDPEFKIKKSFNCTMNENMFRATDSTMAPSNR